MGKKQEYYEETIVRKGDTTTKKGERRIYDGNGLDKWPTKRDAIGIIVGVAAWLALQAFAGTLR